ncbi:hypothetical protein PIB30_089014, partial [Stylosanthes scabra]|nr:hypothetical protein [Stylosanthes scabra]
LGAWLKAEGVGRKVEKGENHTSQMQRQSDDTRKGRKERLNEKLLEKLANLSVLGQKEPEIEEDMAQPLKVTTLELSKSMITQEYVTKKGTSKEPEIYTREGVRGKEKAEQEVGGKIGQRKEDNGGSNTNKKNDEGLLLKEITDQAMEEKKGGRRRWKRQVRELSNGNTKPVEKGEGTHKRKAIEAEQEKNQNTKPLAKKFVAAVENQTAEAAGQPCREP